jgi:antitoxin ParD1/3/4
LDQFVQQRVASGRYQTASEVIREGLRLLELQERDREAAFATLKTKLKRGSEQAEHGEFVSPEHTLKQIEDLKRRRSAKKP